jgi:hypothetical protein
VNQVILRETGADPLLAVQVRALGPKRGVVLPEAEALLSFSDGGVDRASLSPLGIDLVSKLDEERLDWRFVDGSPVTAGYEAQGSMQAQYLVQARNKEFAALWLSPFIRLGYRRQAESSFQAAQFSALGVETVEAELDQLLRREKYDLEAGPLESGFLEVLEDYHRTQDINLLYSLELRWPAVSLLRVIDRGTRKAFLLAYHDERLLPFAMNLTWNPKLLLEGGKAITFPCAFPPALESARRYIQSGVLFLVRGNG